MAEKGTAYTTRFYNRFTSLAKLSVRFAELCVAMSLLAWISARIPLAVGIFGDCFHQLSGVFSNNLFVFFLCHVILVSLMAKSGQFSGRNQRSSAAASVAVSASAAAEDELYEAMVKSCEEDRITTELESENDVISRNETEEIVYEDKQVISEATADSIVVGGGNSSAASDDPDSHFPRVFYRRWRSENFEREQSDDHRSENIRRSESEKYLDIVFSSEEERNPIVVDELSDEDFNRTVEAFIAKQLKFRLQEDGYGAVSASCGDINNKSYELTKEKPCY